MSGPSKDKTTKTVLSVLIPVCNIGDSLHKIGSRPDTQLVQVISELGFVGRIAQYLQGFKFDLSDALAGDPHFVADFFQGPPGPVIQAEPQFDNSSLAG